MSIEAYSVYTDTNTWSVLWPELSLAALAIFILLIDLFWPGARKRVIPTISLVGQVLILGLMLSCAACLRGGESFAFAEMIRQTPLSEIMRLFFVLTSILVTYLGQTYLKRQPDLPRSEFYLLVLLVSAGLMLLSQSHHFVMLFVALETVTVGFYILVSYGRNQVYSLESGLKYLILGALSSAILLFGIVLLYGAGGSPDLIRTPDAMNFTALQAFLEVNPGVLWAQVGAALVIAGIAFKIGAVPFQIWIPDVYQGAPTPVTAFLAVASKAAGFFVLIHLVTGPFKPLANTLIPLVSAMAVVTILFGNITALPQRNVKRLIGLSGIAHAGYLLVGVVALMKGSDLALVAIMFYLFTYLLASFGVFGVMAQLAGADDENQEIDHYQELARKQPAMAAVLGIGLGSLAGIPPLAGFIAKLLLLISAFQTGLYLLLGVTIVGVVISIYYYFGWMREAWFRVWRLSLDNGMPDGPPDSTTSRIPAYIKPGHKLLLGALSVLTVILGFYQGWAALLEK